MAFGRQKTQEPPVEPVGWAGVHTFVISSVERPVTNKRKRAVWGKPAVRVARGSKDLRVLAPCAYLGSAETQPAGLPSPPEQTLFEDPGARSLLCYVEMPVQVDGERRHLVRDGQGQLVGALTRVPPKHRPFKHSWRIEQPGHPEIVGRSDWTSGNAKEITGRVAGKLIGGILDAIGDLGAEGGDQRSRARALEWRAEDKVVMVSQGSEQVTVRAGWVDRRLAFALALIGDD
ncbi:hypothetical protein ACIRU3_19980 [Streptomyces sp. NPDC101151]|uniref:hypothetical protein n=1 Tax=Streptomyces sp. NPDC101151 TaxID=3366115 RepID=UPI0038013872